MNDVLYVLRGLMPISMGSSLLTLPFTALDLLSGETQGFSINAITSPPTVAVIDTGTPANNLSNVSLDASNITQSGTSPKMVHWNSSPYVRWSPHNMFLNSAAPVTQNVTLIVGHRYTYGITGAGTLTGSAGASGAATAGNPVTFAATTTTGTFTVSGGTPTTMQINRGEILTDYLVTTGSMRFGIPQTYDVAASKFGIWIEAATTNLNTSSTDLSGDPPWPKISVASVVAATGPDGSQQAALITENTTNSNHAIQNDYAQSGSVVSTASCYFKAGTCSTVQLVVRGNDSDYYTVLWDIANGVELDSDDTGTGVLLGSSIKSVADGWYRCSMTGTVATGGGDYCIAFCNATDLSGIGVSGYTTYTGTSRTFSCYGPQYEAGTVATSYSPSPSPSTSATGPRGTDDVRVTLTTVPHSATADTLYLDYKPLDSVTGTDVFAVSNGTSTARFNFAATGSQLALVVNNSGSQAQIGVGTVTSGVRAQMSGAWAANDFDASFDGVLGTPDNTGTLPTVTTMYFGADELGLLAADETILIYRLVYVPRQIETATGDLENWRYNY